MQSFYPLAPTWGLSFYESIPRAIPFDPSRPRAPGAPTQHPSAPPPASQPASTHDGGAIVAPALKGKGKPVVPLDDFDAFRDARRVWTKHNEHKLSPIQPATSTPAGRPIDTNAVLLRPGPSHPRAAGPPRRAPSMNASMGMFLLERGQRPVAVPYAALCAELDLDLASAPEADARLARAAAPFPPPGLSASPSAQRLRAAEAGLTPPHPRTIPAAAFKRKAAAVCPSSSPYPIGDRATSPRAQDSRPAQQPLQDDADADADFEAKFVALPKSRVAPKRRRGPYLRPLKVAETAGPASQLG